MDVQHGRGFSYIGKRLAEAESCAMFSQSQAKTTYQRAHCDSCFLMEEEKLQKQQFPSLCYALRIPTEHPQ